MWWQNNSLQCALPSSAGSSACAGREQLFSHMHRGMRTTVEKCGLPCAHMYMHAMKGKGNGSWAVSILHSSILDKHATILPSMKPLWPVSLLQNKCVNKHRRKYRIYHSLHVFMLHIIKFPPFPNLWYTHMKRWNYSFFRWFHSRYISDLDFFHVWILSKVVVSGVLYVIFTLVAWFVFKFNFYLLFFKGGKVEGGNWWTVGQEYKRN